MRICKRILFVFLLGFLGLCIGRTQDRRDDHTVHIQIPNAPETLDCHTYYARSTQCILRNMYSGLYKITQDGKAELDIAKKIKKINKNKWEVYLREDATWSNGETITALDFVNSWNRLQNPNTGTKYLNAVKLMKNYQELSKFRLLITTAQPIELPEVLKHPSLYAFRKNNYSGMYQLKEIKNNGNTIFLQKREEIPKIPTIYPMSIQYHVANENTAMALYKQGKMDIVTLSPNKAHMANVSVSTTRRHYLAFNHQDPLFKSLEMREFLRSIVLPHGNRISAIIGGTPINYSSFQNPSKTLSLKGFRNDYLSAPSPLTYTYQTGNVAEEHLALYVANLLKLQGVDLHITQLPKGKYLEKKRNGELQLFSTKWQSYIGEIDYANLLVSDSSSNESLYKNKKYDLLVKSGQYSKAYKLAINDCAIIPLCIADEYFLCTDRAKPILETLL